MADELNDIVQRMLDAGETEDNIATVIKGFPAATPAPRGRMDVSGVADPEGGLALANIAEQNPAAAVGGAAVGMALPFAPISALAASAGRLLSHRAAPAVIGGATGYHAGGVRGAAEGALTGALLGRVPGVAGRLLSLGRATQAAPTAARVLTPAARAATEGLAKLPAKLVLTPEQAAQETAWRAILQQEASKRGLGYAAGAQ